jgi:hypothetical protein
VSKISRADFSTLKLEVIRLPKRRFTHGLHDDISQKTATVVTTAVRTSDPTWMGGGQIHTPAASAPRIERPIPVW